MTVTPVAQGGRYVFKLKSFLACYVSYEACQCPGALRTIPYVLAQSLQYIRVRPAFMIQPDDDSKALSNDRDLWCFKGRSDWRFVGQIEPVY